MGAGVANTLGQLAECEPEDGLVVDHVDVMVSEEVHEAAHVEEDEVSRLGHLAADVLAGGSGDDQDGVDAASRWGRLVVREGLAGDPAAAHVDAAAGDPEGEASTVVQPAGVELVGADPLVEGRCRAVVHRVVVALVADGEGSSGEGIEWSMDLGGDNVQVAAGHIGGTHVVVAVALGDAGEVGMLMGVVVAAVDMVQTNRALAGKGTVADSLDSNRPAEPCKGPADSRAAAEA